MSVKREIYYFVKKALSLKGVNSIIKSLPKSIMNFVPDKFVALLPIVGRVPIELPHGQCFLLEAHGDDPLTNFHFWRGFGGFEAETTSLFINLAKRSDFIFDIGAHIGYYALLGATVNTKSNIFAFEPVPRIYNRLTENVKLNSFSNVICVFGVVTNFDGVAPLYTPDGELIPCSASTLRASPDEKGIEEIEVPAFSLDSFVRDNNIPKVDLIKIDTERTEHYVLEGARHIIVRDEPVIICEVLKGTERSLQPALGHLGFKYYWITDKGLIPKNIIEGDENALYRNYLFISENRLKDNVWIEKWIRS
ncbi:FkbM family methyltransferase [Dehalococcoidia bacterium]|nr:FkbM family methyltransferase [Dehalococcoidia bacterium]